MATSRAQVRTATEADVLALKGKLRDSDKLEIDAAVGRDPDATLARSFELSHGLAWTGFYDDTPFVMFGVARSSLLCATGAPWLVGTDVIDSARVAVAKRSRQYVHEMRARFAFLENYTDDRHTSAHRWLRWCGFNMEPAKPWGVKGLPFRRFWLDGLLG